VDWASEAITLLLSCANFCHRTVQVDHRCFYHPLSVCGESYTLQNSLLYFCEVMQPPGTSQLLNESIHLSI